MTAATPPLPRPHRPRRKESMSVHRRVRSAWLSLLIVPGLLLVTSAPAAATGARAAVPAAPAAATPPPPPATNCSPVALHPTHFPASPKIDNKLYPLVPGTQFFLDGSVVADDGTVHPHRIATTVTDMTKVIDGVNTLVMFDVD